MSLILWVAEVPAPEACPSNLPGKPVGNPIDGPCGVHQWVELSSGSLSVEVPFRLT
jgi:hypothetical protein